MIEPMLTDLEKQVISAIQGDIPISRRPYLQLAERVGISEIHFLEILSALCNKGVIRRFGATLRHQKSGFEANAMAAWRVAEDRVAEVGTQMAARSEVSHCYRRNPAPGWPYNLYTMIHAMDEHACRAVVHEMAVESAIDTYTLLFSRRELKKTSMEYFPTDDFD